MPELVSPVVPSGRLAQRLQPTLTVGSLLLRPWRPGDAGDVVAAFDNPAIRQWHRRRMGSADEAANWILAWASRWRAETAASWAVADATTARLLGQVGLRGIDLAEGRAEVSYWVLPDARGEGVATGATRHLANWSFTEIGLHRLEIAHATANEPSCRVAEKLGYPLEGTKKSALRHADGWHDMHLHALVAGGEGSPPRRPSPRGTG